MTEDVHERAARLMNTRRVEGIARQDILWLEDHLDQCARCRERERATELALQSLRAVPIRFSPGLVSATQVRVRLRAWELGEQQARMRALWISCGLSWVLGVATAPLIWRSLEWLGQHTSLPESIWLAAFPLLWVGPAAIVGAMLVWRRSHAAGTNGRMEEMPR